MSELDQLKYKGNRIPWILRLAWTIFIVFGIVYLAIFMLPDLKAWLELL